MAKRKGGLRLGFSLLVSSITIVDDWGMGKNYSVEAKMPGKIDVVGVMETSSGLLHERDLMAGQWRFFVSSPVLYGPL